ncbi:MAG: leucine--tRNA ligase [Buchnera aphidicola (Periphyllus acericola)]|uniref:leucine--tRNA ligase n=1 Tax=Buchnera aphidicola TaxID=9 RepID=UPI0030CC9127|nr:leucine--tRNA ligase [Buchnera aphidicola (Periphyllus acericola)]
MKKKYDPHIIEKVLQKKWKKKKTFEVHKNFKKKKYYCLPMLPYPSGNLHIGHVRNYTISDVISRYHRMLGKNVLQPIGWDSFGLPAEEAAKQNGKNPYDWTKKNIFYMKKQLKKLGFSYDWSRELSTCDPNYYKWEQWFFIKLYKKKMIYKKTSLVKWCSKDKTVLANEQVINGKCWRCDSKIKLKKLPQWFIKIKKYAEELYQGIKLLKGWPKKVKLMQKNWIGRSKGIELYFFIKNIKKKIKVFTTKPYSLKKAKYIAISPDHKYIKKLTKKNIFIKKFVKKQLNKLTSTSNFKKIKNIGINTEIFAINPLNKKKIPIWISNFVYIKYGTSAIIASPEFSSDDLEFYNKNFFLDKKKKIKKIFLRKKNIKKNNIDSKKIIKKIIKKKYGKIKIKYKLQNWNISRQRYWGTPIPIAFKKDQSIITIPKKKLPVLLPNFNNYKKNQVEYKIKINKIKAIREKDTFDTFMESSWYYARYTCPNFLKGMLNTTSTKYWLPIDQYIGGIEHATMHLIYIRFYHKLLRDFNLVNTDEPIKKLLCQGMVLSNAFYYLKKNNSKIWINSKKIKIEFNKKNKIISIKKFKGKKIFHAGMIKMSKSKNNGIDPIKVIKKYGADTIRLFIMFAAPIKSDLQWNNLAVDGINRFLKKLWKFCYFNNKYFDKKIEKKLEKFNIQQKKIYLNLNKTIFSVTQDIHFRQSFHTAISKIMKFFKYIKKIKIYNNNDNLIIRKSLITILKLLNPFTPHFSNFILSTFKKKQNIKINVWPKEKKIFFKNNIIKIIIQINGKKCCIISTKKNISKKKIFKICIKNPLVNKKINKQIILKKFFIPNKILNLITLIKKKNT